MNGDEKRKYENVRETRRTEMRTAIITRSRTGVEHGISGTNEEGGRLLEILVHESLHAGTMKEYRSK